MAVREGDSNFSNQMGSEIIPCYVHIGIERARLTNCEHCKRRAYLRVFDTLVETLHNYFVESALFNIEMETKRKSTGSVAKKS